MLIFSFPRVKNSILIIFEMTIPTPPPLRFGLEKWWKTWVSGTKLVITEDWPSLSQVSVKQKTWIFLSIIISKISVVLFLIEQVLRSATLIELVGLGVDGEVGRGGLVGKLAGWGHWVADAIVGVDGLTTSTRLEIWRWWHWPFDSMVGVGWLTALQGLLKYGRWGHWTFEAMVGVGWHEGN